jgi:argininosuccinate synthase
VVKRAQKKVTLEFERGINCCKWHKDKPSAIVTLEKLANAYAIGRDIHVGDHWH